MSQMREFFENLQLNFYLPKLNVVQPFLESVGKNKSLPDSQPSVEYLPGLSKFSHKLETSSRPLILQGELVWMVVVLEKSPNSQLAINLKDPKIEKILPSLKFSITFTKYDKNSGVEKNIPLNARFLESQVFIDEKEQNLFKENNNNTGEEEPLFYEVDVEETRVVYLLKIPVAIHQEHLDYYLNMKVSLVSPMEQVRNIGEPDDATFGGVLNKIYDTLSVNKDKKPYVLFHVIPMKVTNIFDCQSSIHSCGKKLFITLKVKNKLNEVLAIEENNKELSSQDKLRLYIENVDFLLQNSVSRSQYDPNDTEKISPEVNEAFSYKMLSGKMPLILEEDSDFALVIQIEKEKNLNNREGQPKTLIYQLGEGNNIEPKELENSFVIPTEKIGDVENVPKTPTSNPFSKRHDTLSFKEILGSERSPALDAYSSPATARSQFDLKFFQSNLFSDGKGSRTGGPSEGSMSPQKLYPPNLQNIISEKTKTYPVQNVPKELAEFPKEENQGSKIFKLEDSGCTVHMSTPLIIKWSINRLFFTSSIYRFVWNYKDVEIINVVCSIASHHYKVGDHIEVEVEVENKSLNDLQLELIPPSEVLQSSSSQKQKENADGRIVAGENQENSLNFQNMEKALQETITYDQLMAISIEKSIPYGTLKNKDKKKMKMSLLSLNHGTIKLDYLVFYEQQSNLYIKVQVPISFVVS